MKSMEIVPPPSSVAGLRIAFEISGSKKGNCSFKLDEAENRNRNSRREMLSNSCAEMPELRELAPKELQEVLDFADALLSGDLGVVQACAHNFSRDPSHLARCRDRTALLLERLVQCKIELVPSKPFRTNVAGVQTDVLSVIIKEKSTDLLIFIASHPLMKTEVYCAKKAPTGLTELVEKSCDAAQLFRTISRVQPNSKLA